MGNLEFLRPTSKILIKSLQILNSLATKDQFQLGIVIHIGKNHPGDRAKLTGAAAPDLLIVIGPVKDNPPKFRIGHNFELAIGIYVGHKNFCDHRLEVVFLEASNFQTLPLVNLLKIAVLEVFAYPLLLRSAPLKPHSMKPSFFITINHAAVRSIFRSNHPHGMHLINKTPEADIFVIFPPVPFQVSGMNRRQLAEGNHPNNE